MIARPLPLPLRDGLWPALVVGAFVAWSVLHGRVNGSALNFGTLCVTAAIVTVCERAAPLRPDWRPELRAVLVDLFFLVGMLALWGPLTQMLIRPIAVALRGLRLPLWPTSWPVPLRALLAMGVAEFFGYWMHRAQHNNAALWRVHATHHAPCAMGWLKATVNHPLEYVLISAPRVLPLALLSVPREDIEGYMAVYGVVSLLAHANLDLRAGPLGLVWATPKQHLRHHSLDPEEGRRNYGCCLVVWDLLFGTFHPGPADPSTMRIGIDDGRRHGLLALLALPFRRARS